MDLKKYLNLKYIVRGFYSIAKGFSTFDLNPPEKTADEIINKHYREIQKGYGDIESDKEVIREEYQKTCKNLGQVVLDK